MNKDLTDKNNLAIVEKTLTKYKLCDHCLGRLFAKVGHGLSNNERAEIIREHTGNHEKTSVDDCWLCSGLVGEIYDFADLIQNSLKGYEFDTFLVGSKIDYEIEDREKSLLDFTKSEYSEPIKRELNREIGKLLEKRLEREVDFEKPDIMAIVDTAFNVVDLQISSLFVYGRYKKYMRGIPQTRWFCRICRGRGCRNCGYTGKTYDFSVEELIASYFMKHTKGDDESFHGAGREDIDVRMLGNGRPFVLEIKNPMVRNMDLSEMEQKINEHNAGKIEVSNLRFSEGAKIVELKNAKYRKKYQVFFTGKVVLNKEKLKKAAQTLRDKTISQYTPSRVAHRRAQMIRRKKIYNCKLDVVKDKEAALTLEAESGTYIKELISGDDGKTRPSISEIIGVPCKVTNMDVIEIKGE